MVSVEVENDLARYLAKNTKFKKIHKKIGCKLTLKKSILDFFKKDYNFLSYYLMDDFVQGVSWYCMIYASNTYIFNVDDLYINYVNYLKKC